MVWFIIISSNADVKGFISFESNASPPPPTPPPDFCVNLVVVDGIGDEFLDVDVVVVDDDVWVICWTDGDNNVVVVADDDDDDVVDVLFTGDVVADDDDDGDDEDDDEDVVVVVVVVVKVLADAGDIALLVDFGEGIGEVANNGGTGSSDSSTKKASPACPNFICKSVFWPFT